MVPDRRRQADAEAYDDVVDDTVAALTDGRAEIPALMRRRGDAVSLLSPAGL